LGCWVALGTRVYFFPSPRPVTCLEKFASL